MSEEQEKSASELERKPLISNSNSYRSSSFLILFAFATRWDYFLFAIGIISNILFRLTQLLLIWEMGEVVEVMRENNSDKDIFYEEEKDIAIILLIAGGATLAFCWIAVVCFLILGKNQAKRWREKYFNTLLNLPAKWYDKNNASELASTIERDFKNIELGSGIWVMIVLSAIFSYISTIVFAFIISMQLALIMIAPLPIQFVLWIYYMKISINGTTETQNEYRIANGIAEESFEGIKTVAVCNAQEFKAKEYQSNLTSSKNTKTKIGISQGALSALINMNLFGVSGVLFYVGSILFNDDEENWTTGNEIGVKEIVVVAMLFTSTMFYFAVIFPFLDYWIEAKITAEKIYKIIIKNRKNKGITVADKVKGEIKFENVYFSYPTHKNAEVLKGVTFTAKRSEILAIVGQTGSGKSSIIQLIEGFYYAKEGKILIDGVDIREYDLISLREHIGLVSQEPILFNTTIKENIMIGNLNATEEDIEKAAFEAEADFIKDLPKKYETYVGVKGSQLSGGQKQRIAIARALIKNPKILLLDEATSALDVNTERKIQKVLDEASKDRTTIVVAQRLSSIKNANQIIVLDQGKIIESGTHDYLISLKGYYYRFHHLQNQNEKIVEKSENIIKETGKSDIKSYEESYATIKKKTISSVWRMLMNYWPWIAIAVIAATVSGTLFPILGYLFADNINSLASDSESDLEDTTEVNMYYMLLESLIILFTLTLLCGALSRAASLLTYNIRYKGFCSILYYDQKFFDEEENTPSVLCYAFSRDCENIGKVGGPGLAFGFLSVSGLTVGIIIGFIHNVIYTLVVIIFFIFLVLANSTGDIFNYSKNEKYETTNVSYNSLTNIKTVQSLNRQKYFEEKYIVAYKAESESTSKMLFKGFQYGFRYMMLFVVWAGATWSGAYMVSNDDLSMENMTIIFISILFSTYAVLIIAALSLSEDVDDGIKSAIRVNKIINYTPEINADSNDGETEIIDGSVMLNNVSFKYKYRDQIVLSNVSFEIQTYKHLGITGQSGSGKSTIAHLLLRFYDPISGEIKIDGKNISTYKLKYLRENIGYVSQEPILFKGSIFYNLKIGKEDLNEDIAMQAINKVQASEVIEKYGLNSDVGLRGHKLSGGEKQRVAIARALLRNPKILILDESTSALDSVTENKVLNILKNEKMTIISIAHRLRTIRDCDLIVVLEKGIVIEKGNHEELISNENSCYYELFQASNNLS